MGSERGRTIADYSLFSSLDGRDLSPVKSSSEMVPLAATGVMDLYQTGERRGIGVPP